jgi:hypothetical protein
LQWCKVARYIFSLLFCVPRTKFARNGYLGRLKKKLFLREITIFTYFLGEKFPEGFFSEFSLFFKLEKSSRLFVVLQVFTALEPILDFSIFNYNASVVEG